MITFILYFMIGLVPLLIWKKMFGILHYDIVDQVMLGLMWVVWPVCVVIVCLAQMGKLPGRLLDWYERWQAAQYEHIREENPDERRSVSRLKDDSL